MPKQGIPVNREKIKNLRINLGFTQTELGGIAMEKKGLKKISLRTVQKIENDSNYLCSLKIINNLSNIFDVPINELLMDENFDDSKEQSDKESSTSIDEKFHENTKYQFKQNLLVPLKPSPASEKKLPAPEFHHFMTNDKDIEIDKGRKFSISELTLRCLEEHWSSDQACGHELWQYSPEKANVIDGINRAIKGASDSLDSESLTRLNGLLIRREQIHHMRNWPMDLSLFSRLVFYVFIPPLAWAGAALTEVLLDSFLGT